MSESSTPMSRTAARVADEQQHRIKSRILTQPEAAQVARSTNAFVLAHGELFMLALKNGDIPWDLPHGLGLFYRDCRFLDGYLLLVNGQALTPLDAEDTHGFRTAHHLSNPELVGSDGRLVAPKNTIGVRRERVVSGSGCREVLSLTNFGGTDATLVIELCYRAGFEDIFVLRGFTGGPRGTEMPPVITPDEIVELRYRGADDLLRTLSITFDPPPNDLRGEQARFELRLAAGETWAVQVGLMPRIATLDCPSEGARREQPSASTQRWLNRAEALWLDYSTRVTSAHPIFDRAIERALIDLGRLRSKLDGLHYFAAGIPWFVTLFGRDAALTAMLMLPFEWRTAADTLRLLARHQATRSDDYRDGEPGKILHELRRGELARIGAIPQSPAYYGSMDATLLFLILLAEYVNWSGDVGLAAELRPNVDAALRWIDESGDHDSDGYLDYVGEYEHGLINQGWKDSGNAIVNADGSHGRPPIALCEVQGYLYRAWRQTAAWLRSVGDDAVAGDLDRRAAALRERFARDFWSDDEGCYVMGLQCGGRPLAVVSSNAGQVLWSGIALEDHARRVAARLMEPDMFSGWGIRTLSTRARAYNPMGYHLGSVWPHDNALIVGGLLRYGLSEPALRLAAALFEAAAQMRRYRLPELFCGHPRDENSTRPVSYPVACSPQAWAAAALPAILTGLLGLQPDTHTGRLRIVRPRLPDWLSHVNVQRLRVGTAVVDLEYTRRRDGTADVRADVREGRLVAEYHDARAPHEW